MSNNDNDFPFAVGDYLAPHGIISKIERKSKTIVHFDVISDKKRDLTVMYELIESRQEWQEQAYLERLSEEELLFRTLKNEARSPKESCIMELFYYITSETENNHHKLYSSLRCLLDADGREEIDEDRNKILFDCATEATKRFKEKVRPCWQHLFNLAELRRVAELLDEYYIDNDGQYLFDDDE